MNETLETGIIPKAGPSTREVPESFSDLTPEKYGRLTDLLDEHIDQMQKGSLRVGIDLLTGKVAKMNRRLDEITELGGLPDRDATNQLITAASLICLGSKSPEEVMEKVKAGYEKGTRGGRPTGSPEKDRQIKNIVRFSVLTASKIWARRESRKSASHRS